MKPRIYRRHPLNGHLGEQGLQEGSVSKIHIRCMVVSNAKIKRM